MNNPDTLLPCPFCASHGDELGLLRQDENEWNVRCYVCLIESAYQESEAQAIAAWNRRASQAVPDTHCVVPNEPTAEMLDAMRTGSRKDWPSDELCRVRYAALLAAAPSVQHKASDKHPNGNCEKCGKPCQVFGCKYCHKCYTTVPPYTTEEAK